MANVCLEFLALGSWLLLCSLDFAAVASSEISDTNEWASHGLGLSVLAAATLLLALGQWGRLSRPVARKRDELPGMALPLPAAAHHEVSMLRKLRAKLSQVPGCCALLVHGTLVAGGACWLLLQASLGREPQVWMGATTLYTLAALAAVRYALRPAAKGCCLAKVGGGCCGAESLPNVVVYAWGQQSEGEAVEKQAKQEAGAGGQSERLAGSWKLAKAPWFKRRTSPMEPEEELEAVSVVNTSSLRRSSSSRWKPLFKDPTFGAGEMPGSPGGAGAPEDPARPDLSTLRSFSFRPGGAAEAPTPDAAEDPGQAQRQQCLSPARRRPEESAFSDESSDEAREFISEMADPSSPGCGRPNRASAASGRAVTPSRGSSMLRALSSRTIEHEVSYASSALTDVSQPD